VTRERTTRCREPACLALREPLAAPRPRCSSLPLFPGYLRFVQSSLFSSPSCCSLPALLPSRSASARSSVVPESVVLGLLSIPDEGEWLGGDHRPERSERSERGVRGADVRGDAARRPGVLDPRPEMEAEP